jgi:hypothetical protein
LNFRQTPAAIEAVALGIFPQSFASNIEKWDLIIIKGRKKKIG